MSGNEIYLLIKYKKSVLWRVAKRLPCIQEARYLKVNNTFTHVLRFMLYVSNTVYVNWICSLYIPLYKWLPVIGQLSQETCRPVHI